MTICEYRYAWATVSIGILDVCGEIPLQTSWDLLSLSPGAIVKRGCEDRVDLRTGVLVELNGSDLTLTNLI